MRQQSVAAPLPFLERWFDHNEPHMGGTQQQLDNDMTRWSPTAPNVDENQRCRPVGMLYRCEDALMWQAIKFIFHRPLHGQEAQDEPCKTWGWRLLPIPDVLLRRCPCGQVLNTDDASQLSGWEVRREVSIQCGLQQMPPSASPHGDCSIGSVGDNWPRCRGRSRPEHGQIIEKRRAVSVPSLRVLNT
ncbi:hypothetical protein MTO96_034809 [Rhipicephalus appendiculatus]